MDSHFTQGHIPIPVKHPPPHKRLPKTAWQRPRRTAPSASSRATAAHASSPKPSPTSAKLCSPSSAPPPPSHHTDSGPGVCNTPEAPRSRQKGRLKDTASLHLGRHDQN
jgi:hypothetical protein